MALKIFTIILTVYVGIVVLFESSLGYFQPEAGGTIKITTYNEEGNDGRDRIVSRVESQGQLYIAVNHWPRAWFRRTQHNPEIEVNIDGVTNNYLATVVEGAEKEQVRTDNDPGLVFRLLTGFPPRHFLRLDLQ